MWERYCRGVSAILFVVDSAIPLPSSTSAAGGKSDSDHAGDAAAATIRGGAGYEQGHQTNPWTIATDELHALMSRPQLAGIPLLVLATKNDVQGAVSAEDVIRVM